MTHAYESGMPHEHFPKDAPFGDGLPKSQRNLTSSNEERLFDTGFGELVGGYQHHRRRLQIEIEPPAGRQTQKHPSHNPSRHPKFYDCSNKSLESRRLIWTRTVCNSGIFLSAHEQVKRLDITQDCWLVHEVSKPADTQYSWYRASSEALRLVTKWQQARRMQRLLRGLAAFCRDQFVFICLSAILRCSAPSDITVCRSGFIR